jgi:ADP-ribose pyrophosphatase YjhB (NUDIX family)
MFLVMRSCPLHANKFIPGEYRKIAEKLFPPGGFPPGKGPAKAAARAFAEILGIEADYRRLLSVNKTGGEMHCFLAHFQNNLDLLIQKTWIEKADEDRKAKLETRIPPLIREIGEGNFQKALRDFGVILEELAYLFFGAQSTREDFIEYALRIDIPMGLFWWYGGRLSCLAPGEKVPGEKAAGERAADSESLWAVLLLGICYLTNF